MGRPAIPPFADPASLGGLVLWLNATAIDGLVDTDPVVQWDDLSGQGNHATQATEANQPTYVASSINSLPCVRFVTVNAEWLAVNGVIGAFSGTGRPFTLIAVLDLATIAGTASWFSVGHSGTTTQHLFCFCNSGAYTITKVDDSAVSANVATGGDATTNPQVVVIRHTGTATTIYVNGTNETSGSSAQDVGAMTVNIATVGARRRSVVGNFWDGDLGELIIYNRILSDSQRADIETYLGTKWGITVA